MKTIDARGKVCPQPVMMTKQAADAGEKELTVIVDMILPEKMYLNLEISLGTM